MKICHVVMSLMRNSGVSVFTAELANAQAKAGHDVKVWCFWHPDYSVGEAKCEIVKDFPDVIKANVVHVEGLWDLYNIKTMRQCVRQGLPYVVSPHGGLMPRVFKKGRLKKMLYWHLLLKPLMKRAAAIHCTSEAEKEVCKGRGLRGSFVIAPLGVHLPDLTLSRLQTAADERTVLFLGRLGEEKGLVKLLDAWQELTSRFPTWKLVIAGPNWRGHKAVLDEKIVADQIQGVTFTGSADEALKDRLYRAADVFVLPSPMENFSMVVLDALAYGVPAIATKGTPWSELETERCGWWIDQGVHPLMNALQQAMSLSDNERMMMGRNGRRLAERKYQWSVIAKRIADCYQTVVQGVVA